MKRHPCAMLILCLAFAGLASAEMPSLEVIKAAMEIAWKPVQSFTSDVSMDFPFPLQEKFLPVKGSGTLNYLRDKEKDKYRLKVVSPIPEPFPMELTLDVFYDDDVVYTTVELPGMGQRSSKKGKPSLEQNALPPGGGNLFDALDAQLALTPLPDTKVDEKDVFVIEGKPKNAVMPFSKVLFYIDKDLGIQRKSEIFNKEGKLEITTLFSNIQTDTKPSPSLFVPKP